jgi:hypothetical protein
MRRRRKDRSFYAPVLLLALIHPSAWNKNSANFAFWGFCEVDIEHPAEPHPGTPENTRPGTLAV